MTVFAKGTEDAHFIEAKPSFIKTLSEADLFVEIGMELEMGWAPVLQQNARNAKVLPGASGFLDASTVITPLDVPSGPVDRAMGDVHPAGNPHYLLDPINGLRVARLIRDKLIELRPERREYFDGRYANFRQRLGAALVGDALAKKYDVEKLALLFEAGKLSDFLKAQGEEPLLRGLVRVDAAVPGRQGGGGPQHVAIFRPAFRYLGHRLFGAQAGTAPDDQAPERAHRKHAGPGGQGNSGQPLLRPTLRPVCGRTHRGAGGEYGPHGRSPTGYQ